MTDRLAEEGAQLDGEPVVHHYVSRMLLRGFRNSTGRLWEYARGEAHIRQVGVRAAGSERDWHSFRKADGTLDRTTVERVFARQEAKTGPVLKDLLAERIPTGGDRLTFAAYLGALLTRTKAFHPALLTILDAHLEQLERSVTTALAFPERLDPAEFEQKRRTQAALADSEQRSRLRELLRLQLLPQGQRGLVNLAQMRWTLLRARGNLQFVTSDNPAVLLGRPARPLLPGMDPKGLTAEFTLPLSSHYALLLSWRAPDGIVLPAGRRIVDELNARTVRAAHQAVYAAERLPWLLVYVQRHLGTERLFFHNEAVLRATMEHVWAENMSATTAT